MYYLSLHRIGFWDYQCLPICFQFTSHSIHLCLGIKMTNDLFPSPQAGWDHFWSARVPKFHNNMQCGTFCLVIKQKQIIWYLHHQKTTSSKQSYLTSQSKVSILCAPLCAPGSLPLRRRMDDEEEDMSRPISQPWGTPFRDVKYGDRATQIATGQALAAVTAAVPTSQSHHNNNNNSIGISTLPCTLSRQRRIPFYGKEGRADGSQLNLVWRCGFRSWA